MPNILLIYEVRMKILIFVSVLVMAPLSFTYEVAGSENSSGASSNASSSASSGGGYGGGGGAIAGLLLVGGLVYFLTRDTSEKEETSELISQNSKKPNKFEFNFEGNNLDNLSNTFQSTNFESPQNDLKFTIKYNLN
tara:strand:- start:379 stop:789 length:411 start_codon:yes stop_codon:yes gene_type:complete